MQGVRGTVGPGYKGGCLPTLGTSHTKSVELEYQMSYQPRFLPVDPSTEEIQDVVREHALACTIRLAGYTGGPCTCGCVKPSIHNPIHCQMVATRRRLKELRAGLFALTVGPSAP